MILPSTISDADTWLRRRLHAGPASREVIPALPSASFWWIEHDYPSPIARWNYHPEYEIHLIRRSSGSYIIGDQIGPFEPGHVALIGPGLPHDWMSDRDTEEIIVNRDAVVQFTDDWIQRCVAVIPELTTVRDILDSARRGIIFRGNTALVAAQEIESIGRTSGSMRVSHMFAVLAIFANAPARDVTFVTQDWFSARGGPEGQAAVEAGLAYIFANLGNDIRMSDAAHIAHMSEPTFSKYFKRSSGVTFSDMVRKLRIDNACRLLDQSELSISSICGAVGYNNLANFNRQFLVEMGITPSAYRKLDAPHRPHGAAPRIGVSSRATHV